MGVRVSSGRLEDVFSEDSDSNALSLVNDSDGDNPESLGESGPRPYQYEPRRVHRSDPHEDSTEQTAMRPSRKLRLIFNLLCDLFVFDMKSN